MNLCTIFKFICRLLFKKEHVAIDNLKIQNTPDSLQSTKNNNNENSLIMEGYKSTLDTPNGEYTSFIHINNEYRYIDPAKRNKVLKSGEISETISFNFTDIFKLLLKPLRFLISFYNYHSLSPVDEIEFRSTFDDNLETVVNESMKILTQIVKHSKKNFKNNTQTHKLMQMNGILDEYLKHSTKKYKARQEFFHDHKMITKLFTSYLIEGSIYKREMIEIFKRILHVTEDTAMFCYLKALRMNISRIFNHSNGWTEQDDRIILGHQIEYLDGSMQDSDQDKEVMIKTFNTDTGTFESQESSISDESTNSSINGSSKAKKQMIQSAFRNKRKENQSSHSSDAISANSDHSFLYLDRLFEDSNLNTSNTKLSDLLNSLNSNLAIPITDLSFFEKYSSLSFIIELLYPFLRNENSELTKKLFSKKNRLGSKSTECILINYEFFSSEAKRIIRKYEKFRDLYPFTVLDVKNINRIEVHVTETSEDQIVRVIDFIKLIYFFKIFIYMNTYRDQDLFNNKRKVKEFLNEILQENGNTTKGGIREQNGSSKRKVRNSFNYEIAFKTISRHLKIEFKIFDFKTMQLQKPFGSVNEKYSIFLGKINSNEYILIR